MINSFQGKKPSIPTCAYVTIYLLPKPNRATLGGNKQMLVCVLIKVFLPSVLSSVSEKHVVLGWVQDTKIQFLCLWKRVSCWEMYVFENSAGDLGNVQKMIRQTSDKSLSVRRFICQKLTVKLVNHKSSFIPIQGTTPIVQKCPFLLLFPHSAIYPSPSWGGPSTFFYIPRLTSIFPLLQSGLDLTVMPIRWLSVFLFISAGHTCQTFFT